MSTTYPYWNRNADPARQKGVNAAQIGAYNSDLYRANDTRPQFGSPVQTSPGQYATPYGMIGVQFRGTQPAPSFVPPPPTMGGLLGVPRGTSSTPGGRFGFGATTNPTGNFIDVPSTVTRVSPPSTSPLSNDAPSGLPPLGSGTGVGNAMQRWNSGGAFHTQKDYNGTANGVREESPQRQYFNTTGHIDAHAYQANPANNIGAIPSTFDPGGAHMPDRSFLPAPAAPAAPVVAPHQDPANPANTYVPQQYQQPAAPTTPIAPTAGGFGFGATANPTS